MVVRRLVMNLLVLTLSFASINAVSAQTGTPKPATPVPSVTASNSLLAALALDASQMPAGYSLEYEFFNTLETLEYSLALETIELDEVIATGLIGRYESHCGNDPGNDLSFYVNEFGSHDEAIKGFTLLEDETRTAPDRDLTDEPGPAGLGDGPSEITTGVQSWDEDDPGTRHRDLTFVFDRFMLGVAQYTYDGSSPDPALVNDLAFALQDHAASVLAGGEAIGDLLALPDLLYGFEQSPYRDGFLAKVESGILSEQRDGPAGFVNGYQRDVGYVPVPGSTWEAFLTLEVATFSSTDDVQAIFSFVRQLGADYPSILTPVDGFDRTDVDDSFAFLWSGEGISGPMDSGTAYVQVNDQLVRVTLNGGSGDGLIEALTEFTELEIGCVLEKLCGAAEIAA